jgi:hypothetical protein
VSGALWPGISNSCTSNKLSSFSPEGVETAQFQNWFLAFRSPAKIDLRLKLSVMSVSFQARPGDLQDEMSKVCSMHEGRGMHIGFGGNARMKETTWKTKAYVIG